MDAIKKYVSKSSEVALCETVEEEKRGGGVGSAIFVISDDFCGLCFR